MALSLIFVYLPVLQCSLKDFDLIEEEKKLLSLERAHYNPSDPQRLKGTYFSRVPVLVGLSYEVTTLTIHRLLTF